jgi:hypothetical protein
MEKFKYDHLRYNKYYILKPNLLLLIVFAYYLKDLFMALIVAASLFKARGGSSVGAMLEISSPRMMLSAIPVLLLFYALLNRHPEAGPRIRWIWHNGKHLILASAILNSAQILLSTTSLDTLAGKVLIGFLVLNVASVVYVYRSEFITDVFAQFPAPRKDETPEVKSN